MKAGIRNSGFGIRVKWRRRGVHVGFFIALALWLGFESCSALAQSLLVPASPSTETAATSPIPNPESRSLEITLLTIGPGPIFWERFGHNAIVVYDRGADTATAYNYGLFDPTQDDFLINFARGNMRYLIGADDADDDIDFYRDESRLITAQRLAFTQDQAKALRDFLEWNAQPDNATYRYDYYLSNCSTRVRDALDHALGGAIKRSIEGRSDGYTYRMDSLRLMAAQPIVMLAIDLGLGPYADRRIDFWEESFVPAVFSRVLGEIQVTDADGTTQPLVAAETTIERGTIPAPPDLPPDLRVAFLIIGIIAGLALYGLARSPSRALRAPAAIIAIVFYVFCTAGGALLLFLWFGTAHQSAWRNENLLLLNPLCVMLIPSAATLLRARPRPSSRSIALIAWIVALLAGFALFSKILPWFVQANLHWILLFVPIHVALALVMQSRARPASTF